MRVALRYLARLVLGLGVFALLMTANIPPASATDTFSLLSLVAVPDVGADDFPGDTAWNDFLSFFGAAGPAGVLSYGGYLIARTWKEGKAIMVEGFKIRALDAEDRTLKCESRADELQNDLDEVRESRDNIQKRLEDKKHEFNKAIVALENEYRATIEDLHATLKVEIHARHDREIRLTKAGVYFPNDPPPITQEMKDATTIQDSREAIQALNHTNTGAMDRVQELLQDNEDGI